MIDPFQRLLVFVALSCSSGDQGGGNTWRGASVMPDPRSASAAETNGGHVWIVGGLDARGAPSARVDVLAVGSNRWSRAPDLPPEAGKHHLAATMAGGALYVACGWDGPEGALVAKQSAFVLDGSAWRRVKDAPAPRGGATAQAIGGKVWIAGGAGADGALVAEIDAYDTLSDAWSAGAPMPTPRARVASCLIDEKLAVIGGFGADGAPSVVVEAYDPKTNAWERWPDLPTARGELATAGRGDRCFAIGGAGASLTAVNEMFDPTSRRWAVLAPMPTARRALALVVAEPEIWAIGGVASAGTTGAIEAYAP